MNKRKRKKLAKKKAKIEFWKRLFIKEWCVLNKFYRTTEDVDREFQTKSET